MIIGGRVVPKNGWLCKTIVFPSGKTKRELRMLTEPRHGRKNMSLWIFGCGEEVIGRQNDTQKCPGDNWSVRI